MYRLLEIEQHHEVRHRTDGKSVAKLHGDKFFTKLDFSKGYWQIPLDEASKPLTAFTTPDGCYQFGKMPFGLQNSGAAFNRVDVDDVLGHTRDWPCHMVMLRDVFQRIRRAKLTLRPSKCEIGSAEVELRRTQNQRRPSRDGPG